MAHNTQIFLGADRAGKSDFTVPGSAEIRVLAVNASFEDNGAGADWCPAVVMLSDSGHVIARAMLPEVKVTAGGSAEASFFPGVKPGGGAGGGTFQWCRVVVGASTPSGSASNPQGGTQMPIVSFDTSDPANYTQVDGFTWTIPAKAQTVDGYVQVAGGAITTLNGDVTVETNKLGGIGLPVFAANGTKIMTTYFSYTLTRAIEVGGTWEAFVGGADTHQWVMVIVYGAVY